MKKVDNYEMQGSRHSMEDVSLIKNIELYGEQCLLLAVFDGHGGDTISMLASEMLEDELILSSKNIPSIQECIEDAFMNIDEKLNNKLKILNLYIQPGSTAVVCIVFDNKYICANIGDSRAVLYREDEIIPLSRDHKPNDPIERERIEKTNARLSCWYGNVTRVDGLAVSRAFGDFNHKKQDSLPLKEQSVIAFPEIKFVDKTENDKFIVIGCDGLWDVFNNKDVKLEVENYMKKDNSEKISEILVKKAYKRGSQDNISCIILFL